MCITLQSTINSAFSQLIDSFNFDYENIRRKIRKISLFCFSCPFFDSIFGEARVVISLWLILHVAQVCHLKLPGNMLETPNKPFVKIEQIYQLRFIIY